MNRRSNYLTGTKPTRKPFATGAPLSFGALLVFLRLLDERTRAPGGKYGAANPDQASESLVIEQVHRLRPEVVNLLTGLPARPTSVIPPSRVNAKSWGMQPGAIRSIPGRFNLNSVVPAVIAATGGSLTWKPDVTRVRAGRESRGGSSRR